MTRALALLPCLLTAAAALAPEPADVAAGAERLCSLADHLHYRLAARSPAGRPLPMVVLTRRPDGLAGQIRVLVLARQHGDEPAPARAALLWLRAAAQRPALFDQVAVILLPTVNPDGAALGTRGNGAGVDLNRNWQARSQPETQLVERLFSAWQPHLVVDLHEFWAQPASIGDGRPTDWIETADTRDPGARAGQELAAGLAQQLVAAQRAVGESITWVGGRSSHEELCHRAFSSRHHAVALLFEVGQGRVDPGARLLDVLVQTLAERHAELKPRLDRIRGVSAWRPATDLLPRPSPTPHRRPRPAPRPPDVPVGWWLSAAGLVLLCWAKFCGSPADI